MEFKYGIDDRPRLGQLLVYSLQWFVLAVAVIVTSIFIAQGSAAEKVLYTEAENWYQLLIAFTDGRQGSISGYRTGSPFMMNIAGKESSQLIRVESDFFHNFIVELVKFFRTGVVEVSHEETLRIMAVRGAGLKAQACPGQWVDVETV